MQQKKLDELLGTLKESNMNEDEVKVYGADKDNNEDNMLKGDMDMGYDDDSAEVIDLDVDDSVDDTDGTEDLDDLISQLKDIVNELEEIETMDSDDDIEPAGEEEEGEFGDDEADLKFDDETEEVEEAKCDSHGESYGKPKSEMAEATDTASGAGDVAPEGGKATGPEAKEGGSAGKADAAKVGADDEEAIDDTIDAIEKSAPSKDNTAQTGNKVDVKKTNPAVAGTGEGVVTLDHVEVDISKEIKAIISMDSTLSESAQKKTAKLFENAVNKKVSIVNKQLTEQYSTLFEERVEQFQTQLVEKVDQYLDYVVDNYMNENSLAIEEGLKVRVSSSFLEGLGELFKEHYVSVPESKVDLVEKLESEIEGAEAKNNELYEHAIKLRRENIQLRKDRAVSKLSEDLSDVETSKFKQLIEGVDYKNQKQFMKAITAVKTTHFTEAANQPEPQEFETLAEEQTSTSMDKYVSAIRKFK
jgi:hypothetical protein